MSILRPSLFRLSLALLAACATAGERPAASPAGPTPKTATTSAATEARTSAQAATSTPPLAQALDPARGKEVGLVFEAFLSPHQEGDEEEATPSTTPAAFRSTAPSLSRAKREAAGHRGHGQLRFTKDMSRAFVDVKVEGIDPKTVNLFHIHCGKPGILGPILVDFALATDLQKNLEDGVFSVEIKNEHIVNTAKHGHGPVAAFTMGCVIPSLSLGSMTPTKVSTVAGMAQLALEGELYFNLHTTAQTYFGDIRGQIHLTGR